VAFLRSHLRIDPSRIGLSGPSEGGMATLRAGSRSQDLAFLVLLAPPVLPESGLTLRQHEQAARGDPAGSKPRVSAESLARTRAPTRGEWTVVLLPCFNHLLQTVETGGPDEYAWIEETFASAALDRIASWILERSGSRRQ
jgi:hypothetical protein